MKILILGSTGILGNTLDYFLKKKKNIKIYRISRNKKNKTDIYLSDFTDFNRLKSLIMNIKPTHIVNCLGVTKFNNSYKFKKLTKLLNIRLPIMLANFSLLNKIFFIHISTDCVFLGDKGGYSERSKKDALDLYGSSKGKGEVKNKFSVTIRTSFIGPEKKTKKSLMNWFLSQKNNVNGFKNAFFSGITSLELSKIIFRYFLVNKKLYNNIINIGSNKTSKYELLKVLKKVFNKNILIKESTNFKIDRSLNNKRFQKLTRYKTKSWFVMTRELKKFMKDNNYNF